VIAIGQMLGTALVIHLTGGRLESHFLVFGSLAFLAFYRDWRVLLTAITVIYLDHLLRGFYWPESVHGTSGASVWRAAEHAVWVAFMVGGLIIGIRENGKTMWAAAVRHVQLNDAHREMERQVRQRTSQLEESCRQLEAFTHTISHDLSAPLRSIGGFSGALLEDYGKNLAPEGQAYARKIVAASERMRGMLNDLLRYSRTAKADLEFEPVLLGEAVELALHQLEHEVEEKGAMIITQGLDVAVAAHRATLGQVIFNLVSNALKFVSPGVRPQVTICAEIRAETVKLLVEDNGLGIDPLYNERIFELFQRLNPKFPGSGMGLTLVQKAVERMNGKIGLDSQAGAGTRLWVELPRSAPLPKSRCAGQAADHSLA